MHDAALVLRQRPIRFANAHWLQYSVRYGHPLARADCPQGFMESCRCCLLFPVALPERRRAEKSIVGRSWANYICNFSRGRVY